MGKAAVLGTGRPKLEIACYKSDTTTNYTIPVSLSLEPGADYLAIVTALEYRSQPYLPVTAWLIRSGVMTCFLSETNWFSASLNGDTLEIRTYATVNYKYQLYRLKGA